MARIRTIKPEFWTSEQVVECSPMARLLFVGLWNFCDDAGRHALSTKQAKAEVFPADDVTLEDISGWFQELSENGLIACYTADNKDYFEVTGWHHQRIDKPQKPRCPEPVEYHSTNIPRTLPPERKGRERSGKEGKGDGADAPAAAGWHGNVIRLNARDYAQWLNAYSYLDLNAELVARDVWLAEQDAPTRKKWFQSTSKYLANRNAEAKARGSPAKGFHNSVDAAFDKIRSFTNGSSNPRTLREGNSPNVEVLPAPDERGDDRIHRIADDPARRKA